MLPGVMIFSLGCLPQEKESSSWETALEGETSEPAPDVATSTWFPDEDGDGHGDAHGSALESVSAPEGYVSSHDDCDDTNATVFPGAEERCNEMDDDCDDMIDEADAMDASTWYLDEDGDGCGIAAGEIRSCSAPEGYVPTEGDCDDTNATVSPDAEERCNGIDDDCDGVIDGEDATSSWYEDRDGDGYGDPATEETLTGCDGDSGEVSQAGDCDDGDPAISPDAEEVCDNETDEDCNGTARDCGLWGEHALAEATAIYRGSEMAERVSSAIAGGDADGDGRGDVWLTGRTSLGGDQASAVYLILGIEAEEVVAAERADAILTTAMVDYEVYNQVEAGDVDGDGYDDLWAAIQSGPGSEWLCLLYPPFSGTTNVEDDAELCWEADDDDDLGISGARDAGQDINADGMLDAIAGYAWYGDREGVIFYLYGEDVTGTKDLRGAPVVLTGNENEDFGVATSIVPDSNGDGYPDVLIGVDDPERDLTFVGAAVLVDEPLDEGSYLAEDVGRYLTGHSSGDYAGSNVAGVGDLNGDGYGDFAVGAPGASVDSEDEGVVYIFLGPLEARSALAEADTTLGGGGELRNLSAVDGYRDIDGDGLPDLVLGGNGAGSLSDPYSPGRIWLVRSPPAGGGWSLDDADATWEGESARDGAGEVVALIDDTNADGYADIVVGALYESSVAKYAGAAYLLNGGSYE